MKKYIILIILILGYWGSIHAQTPQKMTYVYDALNRLTEVTYPNGSKITYNYDVLGNRTSVVTVGSTPTCAVPTGMQWSNTTATSFQPYWNGTAGYNYVVHYRVSGTTTWTETAQIPCTTTGIIQTTLAGLTNGTNYEWQVKTVCSVGNESTYSTSTFSSTFCQPAQITTPTGINLTATTATIQWGNFGIPLNTNIRWRVVGTALWFTANGIAASQITLSNLVPNATYEVQIQTVCNGGTLSSFSASTNFTTLSCPSTMVFGTGYFSTGTYQVGQTISSQASIFTGTNYRAGSSITLLPGFTANNNTVFSAQIQGCGVPTNGLVLYLPFNGNSNDASGNNNNGVVTGATLGNDRFGVANKAYRFNDGNLITVTNSASLSLTNAFTFSMWVNMQSTTGRDGYGAVNTYGYHTLFTKNCDRGQLQAAIAPASNGTFQFNTYASSVGNNPVIPFALNQWKHLTVVYDGTTLKHFVDGNIISSVAASMNLIPSNSYNLIIGKMGCWSYYFNGFMDEFRMYNRGLNDAEVLNIYNAEKP